MHSKTTCVHSVPAREVIRFLVVTFIVGFALQIVAVRIGVRSGGMLWLGLTMWAPTLGAVASGPVGRALAWGAAKRLGARKLPVALALGFAPRLLQTVVLAATGKGTWDHSRFELAPDGRSIEAIHHVGMMLGAGRQSFAFFALNLSLSITLGAVVVALIGGIGEEIGWRGFLQPAMEQRFGAFRGTLLVGAIWSYWHLPANLSGYNDGEHPIWSALVVFPIIVVAMSFGFAWLRKTSGSAWPVALAHGANNILGSAFLVGASGWALNTLLDVASMGLVAAWFIWDARRKSGRRSAIVDESPSDAVVEGSENVGLGIDLRH